ncbi:MAG: hypothetical protein GY830_06730, partial [Bacteroidetes bacterium]|nr:hypothetical protein [Bacteroidota bacterium]
EEEEEENLTDAMVKLGGAMQASAQYKLIHYKAQRVFRCTLLRKRDNYMRDVEGVYAEECKKQGKDDPNMAQGIYDLLKRHRKLLQNLIQIEKTDSRKDVPELGLRPVALKPEAPPPRW